MLTFRQSTAGQEIPLGPLVDAADGFTPETGLTIANTDIKIWKNAASSSVNKNSGGATHDVQGVYIATLDATDTDTVGPMVITVAHASARPIRVECQVLSAAMFDYLYGTVAPTFAAGLIRADTLSINGVADACVRLSNWAHAIAFGATHSTIPCTTTSITCENVLTDLDPNPTAVDQFKDKVITFTALGTNTAGVKSVSRRILASTATEPVVLTIEALPVAPGALNIFVISDGPVGAVQTGDAFARLGAPAGASVSADVAAVKGVLPSSLTGGGNIKADTLAIDGSTTAADRLEQSARSIVFGTAIAGSTGTSIVTSGLDPAASVTDQFKGRVLIFRSDTPTAALRGQATKINASTAGGVLTVDQLTTVPANDTFVIV